MTDGRALRTCTYCVLDTSVPDIEFDAVGRCQFCRAYDERVKTDLHLDERGQALLATLVEDIKRQGRASDYDCIIGVSGGVDSTYVAYVVKQFGLRPLAVHVDNGWNSELAVQNIEQTLRRLDIDLTTNVLDWNEFRDLQRSFLAAGIANAEIPSDHAIQATLFKAATEHKCRYIITGSNLVTEAILPSSWMYDAHDLRLLKGIQNRFGTLPLKSFPMISYPRLAWFLLVRRIKFVPILNFVPYDKAAAKQLLIDELAWRDYGGKHYESTYTKFFQGYILPTKFGIDKRKAHLSTLIASGQISRDDALVELGTPPYPPDDLDRDQEYVLKKLGYSESEFEAMMVSPPHRAQDYPNLDRLRSLLGFVARRARKRAMK